jgi:orotidine-5'-phosphate decarboxylase
VTTFGDRLSERVLALGNPACVGIDPALDRIPGVRPEMSVEERAEGVAAFCRAVIEVVAPLVPVVKLQAAFFEQLGAPGYAALVSSVRFAREAGLLVLVDAKRGDIGSTAEAYARAILDDDGPMGADAATVSPYPGPESLEPWDKRTRVGKGYFVLVRTSNPGAGAWQRGTGVAARIAEAVSARCPGPGLGPVGAVVGATLPPGEVALWRTRMPRTWFLVPGFGAQGAGPDDVRPHFARGRLGALVSSSREVLYPPSGTDPDDCRPALRARAESFVDRVRSLEVG